MNRDSHLSPSSIQVIQSSEEKVPPAIGISSETKWTWLQYSCKKQINSLSHLTNSASLVIHCAVAAGTASPLLTTSLPLMYLRTSLFQHKTCYGSPMDGPFLRNAGTHPTIFNKFPFYFLFSDPPSFTFLIFFSSLTWFNPPISFLPTCFTF